MKRSSETGIAVGPLDPTDTSAGPRTAGSRTTGQRPTSDRTTSDRTTSHDTTSHDTTSHDTTSHGTSGHGTADLRGLWRRALACLVPVPILALVVGLVVTPYPVGGELRQSIAGAAAHPGPAQAAVWLSVIFALTIAPATMAVAWTGRRGAPWLTLVAGVSLLVAFGAGLPDTDLAVVTAARQGLDPTLVTAIDRAVTSHPATTVGLALFLLGQTVGFVLLGISLWRARVVPAGLGIVLAASGPAHLLLAPLGNLGLAAGWAMTAIVYVGAAAALWRTDNSAFDLAPKPRQRGSNITTELKGPESERTRDGRDARTVWRWLLAIAALPVPIFVAVFRYLTPYDGTDTPAQIFAKLVAVPGYQTAVVWLGMAVALCGCAGALAVAWLIRRRTPVLTTIAMVLAVPGYLALFAGGSFGDLLSYVTRTVPGIDYQTAFQLGSGMESSPQSSATGLIFVAGHLFGTTLLGVALWRARIAPTWLAIGLTVSQPIHLASVMTGIRPLDLLGWGLTAVGFAWAAWRLSRLPNDEFDLPPLRTPIEPDAD